MVGVSVCNVDELPCRLRSVRRRLGTYLKIYGTVRSICGWRRKSTSIHKNPGSGTG